MTGKELSDKELSENDKHVLYALVKYPDLTDADIYDTIGMKKSTFSSIKRKLAKRGYFTVVRIPVFSRIGAELFMVSYGILNRAPTIETRMAVSRRVFEGFSEFVHAVSEDNRALNFAVSANFTEYDKAIQKFSQFYMEHNFLTEQGFSYIAFPFETTSIFKYFDHTALLARHFGIDDEAPPVPRRHFPSRKIPQADMTPTEKQVFHGLVAHPGLTDSALAQRIGPSRNTVARLKAKFLEERLLVNLRIPDVSKLGFRLMAFTHYRFNPRTTEAQRLRAIDHAQALLSPVMSVSKSMEGVHMTPYRDFDDFESRHSAVLHYYMENDFVQYEPVNLLFSIPKMAILKGHVYAPLVKKLLDI